MTQNDGTMNKLVLNFTPVSHAGNCQTAVIRLSWAVFAVIWLEYIQVCDIKVWLTAVYWTFYKLCDCISCGTFLFSVSRLLRAAWKQQHNKHECECHQPGEGFCKYKTTLRDSGLWYHVRTHKKCLAFICGIRNWLYSILMFSTLHMSLWSICFLLVFLSTCYLIIEHFNNIYFVPLHVVVPVQVLVVISNLNQSSPAEWCVFLL